MRKHYGMNVPADQIAVFRAQIDQKGPDDCWLWQGNKQKKKNPYGRFFVKGRKREWLAHRMALALHIGRELCRDEMACHTCDTPLCCNPAHLYVGNAQTNNRDTMVRGRRVEANRAGEKNGNAKLTQSQVDEIRERISRGETNVSIARDYPVGHSTISKIKNGGFW